MDKGIQDILIENEMVKCKSDKSSLKFQFQ